MLRGMGREGAGAWVIRSQRRQDFFGRTVSITFRRAAISSSISVTSLPMSRRAPPQSGQASPGSSTMRSRGVAALTLGLRRRDGASLAGRGSSTASVSSSSSGIASPADEAATSIASRASSSCSISRSIRSELGPNFCRWSRAMRIRSA